MADILRFSSPWTYNGGDYTITTNFVLSWTETVSGNSSILKNITATTEQTPTGSGYKRSLVSGSATINGTTFSFTSGSVYNGVVVLSVKELTIPHDADGSKSISVSMTANIGNTTKNASTTAILTTIATASQLSVSSSYTISSASSSISITVTPYVSGRYHRAYVYYGNSSKTFNLGQINSTSATSKTLDNGSLLDLISNTLTADVTIQLATFQNSDYTGQLGDVKSAGSKINIDKTAIKPSISLSSISKNSGPLSGLIAGYSTAKTTTTITNARGASTAAVSYSFSGGASEQSSSASQVVTNVLPSSASNYTIYISATVVDSRGASATSTSVSASVTGYTRPYFTFNAYRCRSTSDSTADIAGSAVYYSRTAVSYTSGISGNSLTCSITGPSSTITASTAQSGFVSLATSASKTFTATAYDSITGSAGATTVTIVIPAAVYPLDLYQSGNNVGVGLGATAVSGNVVSGLPFVSLAGTRVHNTTINQGTTGYIKFATITNIGNYTNKPIVFEVNRRDNYYNNRLYVRFVNGNTTDPTLAKFYTDYNTDYYIHKSATSTWDLYSYYTGYQRVDVLEYYKDSYNDVTVSWKNEFVASLPTGYVQAETIAYSFNINGRATTASNLSTVDASNGFHTDDYGNFIHGSATASNTWNIKNNGGANKFQVNFQDGNIVTYGQYFHMRSAHDTATTYLANTNTGIYLAANTSGESVYLETKDTGVYHRLNGTNYEISTNYNMWKYEKLLKDFNSYDLATTSNVTIPGGYWYQALVFICRTGTDPSFRHTLIVPHSNIQSSKPSWYYGVSGTSQYAGLYLWRSGNDVIMCGAGGGAGNVYQCYGIGGSF